MASQLHSTVLFLFILAAAASAQVATPKPWGSSLDRRGPGTNPFKGPPAGIAPTPAPRPPAAQPPTPASSGIALAKGWAEMVTQGSGGHTNKMDDLRALLSGYGTPDADTGPHPEVAVYVGPPMDPALGKECRISYLMPLDQAEAALMRSRGMASHARAVAPGFPDGLFLHTYDIKFGNYNRLTIVTDSAKPVQQVVSLLLKNERENWHPMHWKEVPRNWHTFDYVNARNRGQPGLVIHARVDDWRGRGGFIVVNTAFWPPPPAPGWVRTGGRPSETSTWYVPNPLIKLILFSLSKQTGR